MHKGCLTDQTFRISIELCHKPENHHFITYIRLMPNEKRDGRQEIRYAPNIEGDEGIPEWILSMLRPWA